MKVFKVLCTMSSCSKVRAEERACNLEALLLLWGCRSYTHATATAALFITTPADQPPNALRGFHYNR